MPITRATVSTNLPTNPDRKTRAAIREAATAGAEEHYQRHMSRHFEKFAHPKYGIEERAEAYNELKDNLGLPRNPLMFSGTMKSEILGSHQITVTGTRGAVLKMRYTGGAASGRTLDIAAIKRLLADGRKQHDHPRLMRLLQRIVKNGGKLTAGQEQALKRNAELSAISEDELKHIAQVEEQAFAREMSKSEPMRTL